MALRRAQRMNQTTGTSDAASQERGGPQIPRVRKQAIALGVMVAVTTFINIVLYRLVSPSSVPVSQCNLHDRQGSLPGQSCPWVRDEPGTEDSSSWRDLQPHLRETLCLHKALVTLDPDTAHRSLTLSEDGRRVGWTDSEQPRPDNPERFTYYSCVLGLEGFTSGGITGRCSCCRRGGGQWGSHESP
ncbi:butyrophilin subfamily 2 member A2-like isoform X2 [Pleurodeles waltl]|uniref:butyrophilin subfamily 2 member A2-like isoform X2 n=1 Tax=Pleurodeles waltl TaxID=8319 RepID=UPI003709B46B